MIWAAALAHVLDRRFLPGAGWMLLGILAAPEFFATYAAAALWFVGCRF